MGTVAPGAISAVGGGSSGVVIRNRGAFRPSPSFTVNAANGFNATQATQWVVPETDVIAVRVAIVRGPADVTWTLRAGLQASLATWFGGMTTANSTVGTFDGGATSKVALATTETAAYRIPYIWSDWIALPANARSDAGPGSIITAFIFGNGYTGNLTYTSNPLRNDAALSASPYCERNSLAVGDFVTTPTGFGSGSAPTISQGLMPMMEYLTKGGKKSTTFAEYGDSITAGFGAVNGFGPLWQAADLLSSEGLAVTKKQCGIPGAAATAFIEQITADIAGGAGLPSVAIIRAATPNDANMDADKRCGYAAEFVAICRKNGIIPVVATGLYDSTYNTSIQAANVALRTFCANNSVDLLELGNIFDAGNAATYLSDGRHPNTAGQTLLVSTLYAPLMRRLAA